MDDMYVFYVWDNVLTKFYIITRIFSKNQNEACSIENDSLAFGWYEV